MKPALIDKLDKKGLFWFLALTFCSTIFAVIVLWFKGVSLSGGPSILAQYTVAASMFFPGISAFIVRKYITGEGFSDAGLKLGRLKSYLAAYFMIPVLFIITYIITSVFVAGPDLTLILFSQKYVLEVPFSALSIIIGVSAASFLFAPFINSIPAFGEEFGWRGYLLPKLLPLGRTQALIATGLIWGLWHVPFILLLGMHYGKDRILGAVLFTVVIALLGIYIGYLRLSSGSTFLAAFAHGVFNSQFYGVWPLLFPHASPLFGGMTGLAGIFVLSLTALWVFWRLSKKEKEEK